MYGGRPAYTPYSPYGSGYPPQYYPPGMPMYTPPVPVFSGYAPPMEYNPYFRLFFNFLIIILLFIII